MFAKFKAVTVKKADLSTYSHWSYHISSTFSFPGSFLFQYFVYLCKCYYYGLIKLKLKHQIKRGGEEEKKKKKEM